MNEEDHPDNLEANLPASTHHHEEASQPKTNNNCCKWERRWVLFLFAFGCTSLVAGVIYGWPALRRQLQQDGTTLTESQLGAVYTVGSWSVQGSRFFTGLARDKWGTRSVACFSLLCTLAGAIGIALSDASNGVALALSLFCISLGAATQLVMQPVGSLFPQFSNAIISSLSGSFQISGLIFLALTSLSLSRRQAFLGYAAVVGLLTAMAWWLLPKGSSFLPVSDVVEATEHTSSHLLDKERGALAKEAPGKEADSSAKDNSDTIPDPPLTKLQQLVSVEYMALLTWFSLCLVPLQFYVGSIGFQLEQKGDDNGFYSDLFSIVYAASALISPAGGYLSDQWGLGLTQGLSTFVVALSFFILGSHRIPLQGQAAGLVCYSIGRMLIFAMYFSNVGRRFGYANFGTLTGVGLLVSALFSILQYPLIAAASDTATKAQMVNFSSGALLLAMIPYCAWLAVIERKVDSARSLLA